MDRYLQYTRKLETKVEDFDFAERIKPSAVMEYFQDMASTHATQIGVGYERMQADGLCWVLNRLSAVIDRYPRFGEEITVTTFPHKPGVVDAIRDYYITDEKGESLIRGTSRWCVLDTHSKGVRRCAPLFAFDDSQYRPDYAVPDGNPQLPDLSAVSGECTAYDGKVRITDLDRNGHMNNARYADIAVNACDFDFYSRHTIKAFDFNFLCEMKMGNTYGVQVKTSDNVSYFEATGNGRTNPVFRARIAWE